MRYIMPMLLLTSTQASGVKIRLRATGSRLDFEDERAPGPLLPPHVSATEASESRDRRLPELYILCGRDLQLHANSVGLYTHWIGIAVGDDPCRTLGAVARTYCARGKVYAYTGSYLMERNVGAVRRTDDTMGKVTRCGYWTRNNLRGRRRLLSDGVGGGRSKGLTRT